jgi:ribosomal protein L27
MGDGNGEFFNYRGGRGRRVEEEEGAAGGGDHTLFLLCDGLCVGGLKNISKKL